MASAIRGIWHHIQQQPESYERKQYYTFGKVLGAGTFGEVCSASFNPDGRQVAIKVIKKSSLNGNEEMVLKEINIVRQLQHPNIVRLLDWFESKDKYYLVFQLCTGGELFQKIIDLERFTEQDAARLIRCGFGSIAYLHQHNIVHRDIKPENFIFLDDSKDAPLMLADFGIARIMKSNDEILNTMCGSLGYVAPEIMLRQGHGKPVDIWSMGIVTFSSLCGYSPFWEYQEPRALMAAIQSDNITFDERYWTGISEHARDFIRRCLRSNPAERMTAEEALQHPWLTGDHSHARDLLPDVSENFNTRATMQRAFRKIQAINRMRRLSKGSTNSSDSSGGLGGADDGSPPASAADKEPAPGGADAGSYDASNDISPSADHHLPGGWK
ncbi:Calmodulin-dependent protein kinase cmk2 [Coemansia javaensis]|uniref:Calmodulin-dependent protein kinase cmk2 n=1 Tax=Coemansia javaensis TaxID=2761396 RepID=A0A9W8LE49_9FUNG|nr:Calmodulin-dependent protein kinase cmk2 [Coemansia javaensis]